MPFESVAVQQTQSAPSSGFVNATSIPAKVETGAVPAKDEKLAPKLEMLIRRERVALQREQAAKSREQAFASREQAFSEREKKLQEFEAIKQTNPLKALELLGLSYQELTQLQLNDGQITPEIKIKQVEDKFDQFVKSQNEALERQSSLTKQNEEKRQQETLEQFRGQIKAYLDKDPNRYQLIGFEQANDLVYDKVDEHYTRTLKEAQERATAEGRDPNEEVGEILEISKAADAVELLLEQKYDKARSLTKLQALMGSKPLPLSEKKEAAPTQAAQANTPQQRHEQKTLTNALSATAAPAFKGVLTDEQRLARAMAFAKNIGRAK